MQRAIQGSRHSGPKRRNKKAERKAEKKAALKKVKQHKETDEPLPETSYSIELEMYHYLVRGILRVLLSFSFLQSHSLISIDLCTRFSVSFSQNQSHNLFNLFHSLSCFQVLAACHIERKFVSPTFPFGSTQSRYYRRFYPFFRFPHPQPFYFESFQQTLTNLTQHKAFLIFDL
jgi:hypothetical protein